MRADIRYASLQFLRQFPITHCAEQRLLSARPQPRTFPALTDAHELDLAKTAGRVGSSAREVGQAVYGEVGKFKDTKGRLKQSLAASVPR